MSKPRGNEILEDNAGRALGRARLRAARTGSTAALLLLLTLTPTKAPAQTLTPDVLLRDSSVAKALAWFETHADCITQTQVGIVEIPASGSSQSTNPALPDLIPAAEFFLEMFVDRAKAPGGYRVARLQSSEFFDDEKEKALQQRRRDYEARLTAAFLSAGFEPTPPNQIQFPLRHIRYRITGYRAALGNGFPVHKAYDIFVPEGTPVHPLAPGVVVALETGWWQKVNGRTPIRIRSTSWWKGVHLNHEPISLRSGNFVLLYHPPAAAADTGYYSFYAHLAENPPVALGQIVTPDDVIGLVEHSGYAAMVHNHGEHLHLSVSRDLGKGYLEPIRFAHFFHH